MLLENQKFFNELVDLTRNALVYRMKAVRNGMRYEAKGGMDFIMLPEDTGHDVLEVLRKENFVVEQQVLNNEKFYRVSWGHAL